MKKAVLLTALAALCIMMGSCNRPVRTLSEGYSDRSNFNELGEFPLVRERETITVMTYDNTATFNGDTNLFTSFYEEKTNVRVRWIVVPHDRFKERVNLALAGGDQIDVIISGENSQANFTYTEFMRLAEQRVILPIDELIETDTIYFKQRLSEVEGWRQSLTLPDSHIYAIPSFGDCFHCRYYGKMYVNRVFLDNLGIPIPTTTTEFRDMLIAFRDNDANGNGNLSDEIPLMGAIDNFGSRLDTYLISAFIYNDGENRLFLENGRVVAAFARPEFRNGLRFMNDLFREGLISRESFTASRDVRAQLNSHRHESTIGAMPNMHTGNLGVREAGQPVRWIDYESIPPIEGPDGLRVSRYDPFEAFKFAGVIPATSRNPALVMRWLDWFMSDEGTTLSGFGEKGVGWDDADPGATGADGSPARMKVLEIPFNHPSFGNITWGAKFPNFRSVEYRNGIQVAPDMFAPDGSGRERYQHMNALESYAPFAPDIDILIPPLYFPPAQTLEMTALVTTINTYVNESIARFTVGTMNIETEWDTFQANLSNLGLQRYLDIVQNAYDISPFNRRTGNETQ